MEDESEKRTRDFKGQEVRIIPDEIYDVENDSRGSRNDQEIFQTRRIREVEEMPERD